MYDIHDAPVFQKTFDLIKSFHTARNKFPKMEKYTLGEQTENALLGILLSIVEAGRSPKHIKIVPIERDCMETDKTQILVRLSATLKILPNETYIRFSSELQQIGCMLGGWKKSL